MNQKGFFLVVTLLSVFILMPFSSAQTTTANDFTVSWELLLDGMNTKVYEVTVQNLDTTTARGFNLSFFVDSLNVEPTEVTNIKLFEQVNESFMKTVFDFSSVTDFFEKPGNFTVPPPGCSDVNSTHFSCDNLKATGSHLEADWRLVFESAKEEFFKQTSSSVKKNVGSINIAKGGVEDPDAGTLDGKKVFRVQFDVPLFTKGRVGFFDENSEIEYHPFFDDFWRFKQPINATNTDPVETLVNGYTLNLTFDHASLVAAGESNANGTDVRVAENDATELDRVLCLGSAFNRSDTCISFNLTSDLAPLTSNTTGFQLYYGNPGAGPPPANLSRVFLVGEDWAGDVEHFPWQRNESGGTCAISVSGEMLHIANLENFQINCIQWLDLNEIGLGALGEFKAQMTLNFTWTATSHNQVWLNLLDRNNSGWDQGTNNISAFRKDFSADGYNLFARLDGGGTQDGPNISASSGDTLDITTIYSDVDSLTLNAISNSSSFIQEMENQRYFYLFSGQGIVAASQDGGDAGIDNVRLMRYTFPEPTTSLLAQQAQGLPNITILNPQNVTFPFGQSFTPLQVTSNVTIITWKFNLDNGSNQTFTPNTTITGLSNGPHTLTVFALSAIDLEASETVTFTVNTDAVIPSLAFVIPILAIMIALVFLATSISTGEFDIRRIVLMAVVVILIVLLAATMFGILG